MSLSISKSISPITKSIKASAKMSLIDFFIVRHFLNLLSLTKEITIVTASIENFSQTAPGGRKNHACAPDRRPSFPYLHASFKVGLSGAGEVGHSKGMKSM